MRRAVVILVFAVTGLISGSLHGALRNRLDWLEAAAITVLCWAGAVFVGIFLQTFGRPRMGKLLAASSIVVLAYPISIVFVFLLMAWLPDMGMIDKGYGISFLVGVFVSILIWASLQSSWVALVKGSWHWDVWRGLVTASSAILLLGFVAHLSGVVTLPTASGVVMVFGGVEVVSGIVCGRALLAENGTGATAGG